MAKFSYRARWGDGKTEKGIIEALDREDLVRKLRSDNKFLIEASEQKKREEGTASLNKKELSIFCRQMSAMLGAGIGMSRALDTLYRSGLSRNLKSAALSLYEGVLSGASLSDSMKRQGKRFPELLVYMTETGEASGELDRIMDNMSDHYASEEEMQKKVKSALTYPVILAVVSVVVIVFMLTKILPTFIGMYGDTPLPVPTRILMAISNFLISQWGILLGAALVLTLLFTWLGTKKGYRISVKKHQMNMRIFGIGNLIRTIMTSRFASTFAILYSSGISILQCMDISSRVMSNDYVEDRLKSVAEDLRKGRSFADSLTETEVFDKMLYTMVSVGEESGSLDSMLMKTGEYFRKEADSALNQLIALIDPVMIIIFGVIIGFIVLAIMLPIFGMYQQIM